MKKLIFAISIFLLFASKVNAQFYGQIKYTNPSYGSNKVVASSAYTTSAYSSGYIATSYVPSISLNSWQIVVRKTDQDGGYSTADEFNTSIGIHHLSQSNCNAPPTLATDCGGVTAIETNIGAPTSGSRYALVATVSDASTGAYLVFLTLDQSGTPVNSAYYDFPANVTIYRKPVITEDPTSSGNYYVCGSYIISGNYETMYVLKINISGTIIWSQNYDCGKGIEPRAIIKSPYSSNEIVVIGRAESNPSLPPFLGRSDDGFFLKLNSINGSINLFRLYGESPANGKHNWFNSIALASSTYGGSQGFVIGGLSQAWFTGSAEGTWMLKISPTGNVHWSTIIDNGGLGATGEATGVFERLNGSYTYFCGTSMTSSVRAIKLDNTGTLYSSGSGNNQFDYNWANPTNSTLFKTQLTCLTGTSGNDGFQLFSTDGSGTGQDNYFIKTYFDGTSGCSETLATGTQGAGPSNTISPSITASSGLTQGSCPSIFWDSNPYIGTTSNMVYNCQNTSIATASNARQANTTVLTNKNIENKEFVTVYPNPNNGEFYIVADKELKLQLINEFGQVVKNFELNTGDQHKIQTADIAKGIYFIVDEKKVIAPQKIIVK